jgi:adenylate cyclase
MQEIERKFLVIVSLLPSLENWPATKRFEISQGYLVNEKDKSIRVRTKNEKAFLTFKMGESALSRTEIEYEISAAEAQVLLTKWNAKTLQKTRFLIENGSHTWELDRFEGKLNGLWLAEIELKSEDEQFELPIWLGEEVTHNTRFLNANLIENT